MPGGKIDANETAIAALCREVQEEMNVPISESELQFYTHITAPAFGEKEGIIMEQDCFLLQRKIVPTASAEVARLAYFSVADYKTETHQAPGALMVLQQLQLAGLID